MQYTYFLVNRPPDIGTYPRKDTFLACEGFESRAYVTSIDRYAWGWVSYSEPLTDKEIEQYELVKL